MTINRGSSTTPAEDAFYLPADASRHVRTWIAWPGPDVPHAVTDTVAGIVQTLAEYEPVTVVAPPDRERMVAVRCRTKNVTITALPHTTARLRDTGPTFLVDGKGGAAAVDWQFSGWGTAAAHADDAVLAHALLGTAEVRRFRAPLSLMGSAIMGDGRDTAVALTPAVFDDRRNPRLSRLEAFSILQSWLAVSRVIWLDDILPGDATGGDVRALCAFVAPSTVLVPHTTDAAHPHAAVLTATNQRLAQAKDALGQHMTVLRLPVPAPHMAGGATLPLSYATFYPANGVVLAPAFDDPADDAAAEILARVFPERDVQKVPALELARAGLSLASLMLPHPARLLERDRATVLPRSAWSKPAPDYDALIQKYADMAEKE